MAGARWTPEQLAERLSEKRGRLVVVGAVGSAEISTAAGAPPKTAPVPKGLRLSNDRQDMTAEYLLQIRLAGLPMPEFEFRFHDSRQWRSDFAWPDRMLLAEYEGGIYTGGRHTRGQGFDNDCEKYNEAELAGYRLLRFTHRMVATGMALEMTERALQQ